MTTLQGAFAFEQVDRVAVAVARDLDLDVAHLQQVALSTINSPLPNGRRLAIALSMRASMSSARSITAMPPSAAAGDRLRQHRQRHVADARRDRGRVGQPVVGAVDEGQAGARRLALRAGLAADPLDRRRVGPMETSPAASTARANAAFSDKKP